jgi:hypothetical protein
MTHKPGLFLSRIMYFNNMGGGGSFFQNLLNIVNGTFFYFTQSTLLQIFLMIGFLGLIVFDIKEKSKNIWFAMICFVQIIGLSFVTNFYSHYILAIVPFFLTYLISPRKNVGKILSHGVLYIILVSSLFSFPKQITKVTWESNIASTRYIADTISRKITDDNLKNNNIAVLGSPDTNTYGRRYRDLLLIKGIPLRTKGEYEISDHLFIVSEEDITSLRGDPSYEIKYFKDGELISNWDVPNSPWKIYLLSKNSI